MRNAMTPNIRSVLNYLDYVEQATLRDIYDNTSLYYFANEMKHTGEVMARLVKSGKVERVQKGIYKLNTHYPTDINDLNLFNQINTKKMTAKELYTAVLSGEIDLADIDNAQYKLQIDGHIEYLEQKQAKAQQEDVEALGEEIDKFKNLLP